MNASKLVRGLFGIMAVVSVFLIFGIVGGIENNSISFLGGILSAVTMFVICRISCSMQKRMSRKIRRMEAKLAVPENVYTDEITYKRRQEIVYKKVS